MNEIVKSKKQICDNCGDLYAPRSKRSGGKQQRFCRPSCRYDYHKAKRSHSDGDSDFEI